MTGVDFSAFGGAPVEPFERHASDATLVRACLAGNDEAWSVLIDKYKRLIYSVPIRGGASRHDAADLFQAVCLELFTELPRLRRVESLRGWLLTIASNKLYQLRRTQRRALALIDDPSVSSDEPSALPASVLEELERTQQVREAIEQLPPRCRELVHLLFYEHPPRPYRDVARQLGLATGSIGFIRGRCLARLESMLRLLGVA